MPTDPHRPPLGPGADGLVDDAATHLISVAAQLAGMHAQTLRSYDREGLVSPERTSGGGRRYSGRDIELLREVHRLSQDDGVNRAGIRRIIELEAQVDALRSRLDEMQHENTALTTELATARIDAAGAAAAAVAGMRRDLVPYTPTTAVVRWRPRQR
ncbi:helix-turn-helix transcriptional regulator [Nakamurella sp. A5-74]|uniref:Helix-turn-helix transcriptional regulator n=1 Tax=Nakamurella sp. A5-74 TaxID=3158264 RepID=A0AAU8DQ26_9ACTN